MHLSLALALELSLLFIPQLLVELGASTGLVAVHLCGQGSVDLAQTVLLGKVIIVLLLALGFTLELVGNGALILCGIVSVLFDNIMRGRELKRASYVMSRGRWETLTGVLSLVRVLLALVEAVLSLGLLDLSVAVVALVTGLIDLGVTDVGLSGHFGLYLRGFWGILR